MSKVSVCVPVFNVEKYMSRCLRSILSQSYADLEIIVVDDCSTDATAEVVRWYARIDGRVRLIRHEANKGPMYARRTAYMAAVGDYLTFCDGDDALSDADALSSMVTAMERTGADIVSGIIRHIDVDGRSRLWKQSLRYGYDADAVLKSLLRGELGHNLCGKLFARRLMHGYEYLVYEHFTNGEDGLMFYQIVQNAGRMQLVERVVYDYYRNMESSTNRQMSMRSLMGLAGFYDYVVSIPYADESLKEESMRYAVKNMNEFALSQGFARVRDCCNRSYLSFWNRARYMSMMQNVRWYALMLLQLLGRIDRKSLADRFSTLFSRIYDDESYIRLKYRLYFGKEIDLESPKGFNEKLNWMKLHVRNPRFTMMADKFRVKKYVSEMIGDEYVVPCYGCWKNVDDIDWELLPEKVFFKSTHDSSGGVLVDRTRGTGTETLKGRFRQRNWYWHLREWPYKDIEPQIIAEHYLDDGTGDAIKDYKFLCFNGQPKYMYITNKGKYIYENFYDMDFRPVDISHGYERTMPEYDRPADFEKMKELAGILSKGHPFIRVDFFNVAGRLYFGEFTFYDWGGMRPLSGDWERILGEQIDLNVSHA